ncbi:MAG: TonB-dependent receptor plug domain-containing protein, partial [Bacteroidota bacterium]
MNTRKLVFILSAAFWCCSCFAETIELKPIVVTPRRSLLSIDKLTDNVITISSKEIEALPASNAGELLKFIPGVDMQITQGFGRPTSISIQGSDSRQVRVMIDGILLNSQASGQADPSRIPVENIERIEIIKGPSSAVWGSSLGGVINIITKETGEKLIPDIQINSSVAEFNTQKESINLTGKAGPIGYCMFANHMKSAGIGKKDDVLDMQSFYKLSYAGDSVGKIVASFGYNNADLNSGIFPDNTYQNQVFFINYGKIGWKNKIMQTNTSVDFKYTKQNLTTKTFVSIDDIDPFWTVTIKDLKYQLSMNAARYPRDDDAIVVGADVDW